MPGRHSATILAAYTLAANWMYMLWWTVDAIAMSQTDLLICDRIECARYLRCGLCDWRGKRGGLFCKSIAYLGNTREVNAFHATTTAHQHKTINRSHSVFQVYNTRRWDAPAYCNHIYMNVMDMANVYHEYSFWLSTLTSPPVPSTSTP